MLAEIYLKNIFSIQEKIYNYKAERLQPSDWVQSNIYMTSAESRYPGFFNYDRSPYSKEIIDCLSSESSVESLAVMKCNQSGFTAGVIIPFICYTVAENPSNMMFLSGTEDLAKDTVRDKLDPVIQNSGIGGLIRSSDTRRRNNRTGNTDFKKEFAGGTLNIGSYKPSNLRMHTVRFILADEFDDAPRDDKKEGSTRFLLENRTTSYGNSKKLLYISTPTVHGHSNIEDIFEEGDKRKWNWECPHCKKYIPIEWRVSLEDDKNAGIKWKVDDAGELIVESIHYECQECGGHILEKDKYEYNLNGKWIPTVKAKQPNHRSYQLNALTIPPGYDGWEKLIRMWMEAHPKEGGTDIGKLKSFINTKLGQTWVELGTTPRVHELMQNTRSSYFVGTVPDKLSVEDGNGKIMLITMSCDLGGVMEKDNEDVRIDWEIVAHCAGGQTYSIDHGSIGTFKKNRKKTRRERENESERIKYTYAHGHKHSVWPFLKEIIEKNYHGQDGDVHNIDLTAIDTGHFTKLTYDFIREYNNPFVIAVKGHEKGEYSAMSKDTPIIKRSQEQLGKLYILQVNRLKDILAANMKLSRGMDGYQPAGFMNFPQPEGGKYNMRNYFEHYEGEHRTEKKNGDVVVGFAWMKKNSSVENHFFDVAVYNLAAKEIYIDILRRWKPKYKNLTWELFVRLKESIA